MKIWDKGFDNDPRIDAFTVGRDRELDLLLAPYDIEGTMAHIRMLEEVGLLSPQELEALLPALEKLHQEALDLKFFTRARMRKTLGKVQEVFGLLLSRAEAWKDILMPGYTHLQVAMPSSFGLWLGAYAECLCDEMDSCLDILLVALPGMEAATDLMSLPLYEQAFCVEEVNRLTGEGIPFRDAYRQVGKAVREGTFHFCGKLHHTHEGSIGRLCLAEIDARFRSILSGFTLQKD